MSLNRGVGGSDTVVDPDFLALTPRQRQAIDKAFERGCKLSNRVAGSKSKSRKKRKLDNGKAVIDDGGGFEIDDEKEGGLGGGFVDDDDGGGFIPDDGGGGGGFISDDEGGFLADENEDTLTAPINQKPDRGVSPRVPLRLLPGLLTRLNLPTDEDVLSVFQASASGWTQSDSKKRSGKNNSEERNDVDNGDEGELGVTLRDFRAVCAALMDPEQDEDLEMDVDSGIEEDDGESLQGEGSDDDDDDDDDDEEGEDIYEEEESDLSSLSGDDEDEDEYKLPGSKSKSKAVPKPRREIKQKITRKGKEKEIQSSSDVEPRTTRRSKKSLKEDGPIKLTSRQKEIVKDIWDMLKSDKLGFNPNPNGKDIVTGSGSGFKRGGNILGRDEVKKWARSLAETWSEDEITDMVKLFSTQHENRGLSLEDFGVVMVRAGLA